MELQSKRLIPEYNIVVKIRQAISEKEYKTISKPVLKISKIFKAFQLDDEPDMNEGTNKKPISNANSNNKIQKIEKEAPTQKANQEGKIDPSIFNQIDLTDPENIELLNTLKVIDAQLAKVDAQIKKIEGRAPPNLRQQKLSLSVKSKKLKEAISNGEIPLPDYIKVANMQLERDIKLAKYFKQIADDQKAAIVMGRINILKAEIESCK